MANKSRVFLALVLLAHSLLVAGVVFALVALFYPPSATDARRSDPEPAPISHAARPLPEPFVDAFLKAEIEDRGGMLAAAGNAATTEDLAEQLYRDFCALTLPTISTDAADLPGVYRGAVPGTLAVSALRHCDNCGRWHVRIGATAFAITADGACVTNYHVFAQKDSDTFMVVSDIWGETFPVLEVLAASRRDDIVIFRIRLGSGHLAPIALRPGVPVGSTIAVLGHPGSRYYAFSSGMVSRRSWLSGSLLSDPSDFAPGDSHPRIVDRSSLANLTRTLEITADYGVGASGGPVLDLCGNAVGMVSSAIPLFSADRGDRRTVQMNFHECVPAESILALIRER